MLKDKENEIVPFKYEDKLQVCDILKKTKHLIKSSNKYCDYMEKYTYITQITTFKLPEITSYPILKNNELIPLNKTTFEFFRPKSGDTHFIIGENTKNFLNGNNDLNGLPSRPHTQIKQRQIISQYKPNSFQNNSHLAEREKGTCFDRAKETGLDECNNEFLLDKSVNLNNNLKYEGKENVENLINKYLMDDNINPSTLLKQNIQKINKVTNSYKLSSESSNKTSKIKHYEAKDLKSFFIERVETLKNNNFITTLPAFFEEKNENQLFSIQLKSFSVHFRNIGNDSSDSSSLFFEMYIPFEYIPIIYSLDNCELINIIVLCSDFNEDYSNIKLNHQKFYLYADKSGLMELNNTTILKHFSSIPFHWIISDKIFEVTLRMPYVNVNLEKSRSSIKKIIDFEIMMHLYSHKFENWNVIIKEYLNCNKKFRETICKYNSKISNKCFIDEDIPLDLDMSKYFSDNDKNFYFGFTVKNVNKFAALNSFKINCKSQNASLDFDFNFKQFRLIEEFSKHLSMDSFLKKLVVVSKKKPYLSLDLTNFNQIDENFLKFMKKPLNDNENRILNTKVVYKITKPFLRFRYLEEDVLKNTEIEIPNEIIKRLVCEQLNGWYKIIGENYEEIIRMKELQIVKQEAIEHKDSLVKTQGNPKRKNTNNE